MLAFGIDQLWKSWMVEMANWLAAETSARETVRCKVVECIDEGRLGSGGVVQKDGGLSGSFLLH